MKSFTLLTLGLLSSTCYAGIEFKGLTLPEVFLHADSNSLTLQRVISYSNGVGGSTGAPEQCKLYLNYTPADSKGAFKGEVHLPAQKLNFTAGAEISQVSDHNAIIDISLRNSVTFYNSERWIRLAAYRVECFSQSILADDEAEDSDALEDLLQSAFLGTVTLDQELKSFPEL